MSILNGIQQYCARIVRFSNLTLSNADGKGEQADGHERGRKDPSYGFGLRRFQHYGFASWVPRGAQILALAIQGGKNNRVHVASKVDGAEPTLAAEGDTVLYNSKAAGGTTTVYMDNSGNITLTVNGGNVNLGDGNGVVLCQRGVYDALVTFAGALHTVSSFAQLIAASDALYNTLTGNSFPFIIPLTTKTKAS